MLACWSRECEDRPSFQTLSEELYNMQKEEQPYVNVDPSQSFILPPTAGRGIMSIKCGLHFWRIVFYTPGYTCCIVRTNLFFNFISDTVGNLIAFSDGTFSGETADRDEVEMVELPKTTASIISMVTAPEPQRYYNRLDRCCHNLCQKLFFPLFVQYLSSTT